MSPIYSNHQTDTLGALSEERTGLLTSGHLFTYHLYLNNLCVCFQSRTSPQFQILLFNNLPQHFRGSSTLQVPKEIMILHPKCVRIPVNGPITCPVTQTRNLDRGLDFSLSLSHHMQSLEHLSHLSFTCFLILFFSHPRHCYCLNSCPRYL